MFLRQSLWNNQILQDTTKLESCKLTCFPILILSPKKWHITWRIMASNNTSSVPETVLMQDWHMAARVTVEQQTLHTNPDAMAFSIGKHSRHWCFCRLCSQILLINDDERYVPRATALPAPVLSLVVRAFLCFVLVCYFG